MELIFLGTRGETSIRSRRHYRHSALLIRYRRSRIMIDCGTDWLGRLPLVEPTSIVLAHAHPDHAFGLERGASCPVYATTVAWDALNSFPVFERRKCHWQIPLSSTACNPVEHSVRAPAVGYRVSIGSSHFFYVPDVAQLPHVSKVLREIDLYIGDGASIKRSMVRCKSGSIIGHASIVAQLSWCAKARVQRALFTHCGSGIIRTASPQIQDLISQLGEEAGVKASLVSDGDHLTLPPLGGQLTHPVCKMTCRREPVAQIRVGTHRPGPTHWE
jgi:phosphoribosyl 1,2-cyclic phosphodiesterase